jgi:isoquinoline 1-oxidoreductase alpha subunit
MVTFVLNGSEVNVDVPDEMPVLWMLRDRLGLTGAKYGCGIAQCGACTIHVDGKAIRSCMLPAAAVSGKTVVTIEGLSDNGQLHPVQQAWIEEQVPQCGYCQPGLIMSVTAFLRDHPQPDDAAIDENITNICRCGTYPRIRKAIHRAAKTGSNG